jgi:hypothetical protein
MSDLILRDPAGLEPDRVTHALGFEELVDLRVEGCIASEMPSPIAGDHRLQHGAPTISAVDVARP